MADRHYRAGDSVEDACRACKTDRMHTVIAADPSGHPLRVVCGFCGSDHNFRGGPRVDVGGGRGEDRGATRATESQATSRQVRSPREPFPIVSERERIAPPMTDLSGTDLEMVLRRIIREESGITAVTPAEKWRGGTIALRPGNPALQEKTIPIETFFNKVVMLRNRLRTLEQQVNATELPPDVKVKLQGYISGCYGSLTTFNVLFADEEDQF
ncbi:MAG TPA: hypothetical protein VM493_01440, partial [Vicinamibacterales bacterium]|nr:hypothetical protein [Vicinamibacterales bacterium]